MVKLNCQNCSKKCCEGTLKDKISGRNCIILPKRYTKVCVQGIQLVRISRTKWKCKFFKRGKCSNYENRPWICRYWFCKDHPKKPQYKFLYSVYEASSLCFQINCKGRVKHGKTTKN